MPRCEAFGFQQWKRGNSKAELEDSLRVYPARSQPSPLIEGPIVRAAVADGATEGSFSKEWAKMLVRAYCRDPFRNARSLRETVDRLAPRWHEVTIDRRPLPWYALEKARLGAFAAFLGLDVLTWLPVTSSKPSWTSIAVGDSCLFQVRGNRLLSAFPLRAPDQFNSNPTLISSNPARNNPIWPRVMTKRGSWQPGDVFILATDALSAWFLSEHQMRKRPWIAIEAVTRAPCPHEVFASWANALRASGAIRNDDVTCVLIRMCEDQ